MVLVMVTTLHDGNSGGIGFVNQPMFPVYVSGPIAGPVVL